MSMFTRSCKATVHPDNLIGRAKSWCQDRLRGLLSGGADRASRAFASLRQKAKQAVDAVDARDPQ